MNPLERLLAAVEAYGPQFVTALGEHGPTAIKAVQWTRRQPLIMAIIRAIGPLIESDRDMSPVDMARLLLSIREVQEAVANERKT